MQYYLAIDLGASSGRHMLAHLENGRMVLEEVYRFDNQMIDDNGCKCWDTDYLFAQIKAGMRLCAQLGKIPTAMGVDTWGVDFVLLDGQGRRLGPAMAYRDHRTQGMDEAVYRLIPEHDLFRRTGVTRQIYNTVYQLMALKARQPDLLDQAETLLMTPDYYHYLLTGVKGAEYTIATTGQLVRLRTRDWDWPLIHLLEYPHRLFPPVRQPGEELGFLRGDVCREVGFNCRVILPPSHDTASAVLAVPARNTVYISSGTWSLMGVELPAADCSDESHAAGFTNEGGYGGTYRYLKNIMGLWMIQSVRREYNNAYSFPQLCAMAEEARAFPSRVDVNDDSFFAPDSMIHAIQAYCCRTEQPVPQSPGEIAAVIYQSLAACYGQTIQQIERITGQTFASISVVGGGSNADYLNQLTANATGKPVYAGPAEAAAIGNVMAQMLKTGEISSLEEAKACVFQSFQVKTFRPDRSV